MWGPTRGKGKPGVEERVHVHVFRTASRFGVGVGKEDLDPNGVGLLGGIL